MKKEQFLHKSVTIKSEIFPDMEVTRTRTSKGFSSITITFGSNKNISTFTLSNDGETKETAGEYEQRANEVGKLLMNAAVELCLLPDEIEQEA